MIEYYQEKIEEINKKLSNGVKGKLRKTLMRKRSEFLDRIARIRGNWDKLEEAA